MKLYFYLWAFALTACHNSSEQKELPKKQLTNYVNPFIGTDGTGNTYPGAMTPFGMVQLSPDIGIPGWDRISGYFYPDSIITGFSHTHLSGTGAGDLYDVLIMPTNSRFNERIEANNRLPFSYFSHKHETATAGYYSVDLLSYGIKAELTATPRVGVQRYTFPNDEQSKITIDLGYSINWDKPTETYLKVVDNTTLEGYRFSTGWARNQKVYFVIKLSKPFADKKFTEEKENGKSNRSKIVLRYATADNEAIVVKTALSMHSIAEAYKNMEVEAPHFAFDNYRETARNLWEKQLQKITVEGGNEEQKTIFYTMLYQSMLAPNLFSDVDAPKKRYDTFSLWDTFRAAHPLYTLLHRAASADFISSFLAHYRENSALPVWSMQGGETNMMIGYHAVPVIVDAYFKKIPMDIPLAYEACKQSAMVNEREIDLYKQYGYVPYDLDKSDENWSVSKTLEYAYDDWCIAQFAKALNKKEDEAYFAKRAENWRNLFDEKTTFFRPKDSKGQFIKPFNPKDYSKYFCESNAWHYRWFVPQNIEGLRNAMGGIKAFEQKLDSMFTLAVTPDEKLPIFSTGMIGQYVHGNEPSHHVAYLYHFTNHPEKATQRVTEILNTQYKNTPDGHCGNEDCGQMSSWYVLSALGLYPLNPANSRYYISEPLFDKATLHLENGKTFTIEKRKDSKAKTLLNDKPLNRGYITYEEIIAGGRLEFKK
ncbi:GH92 family glycosyl hydrolase [Capnocytophaga sp. oral taxon 324]|uniref:GH92 family glycosyl hydrolase n=1 Tax=Capnocytophaga sp. oral taxon 324 TaxID=712211 RepID=UPI0002A461CA|nr:GH92 family glycosyl hydrolase [Capnocytophaga sp. oral taxon 324]EKY12133.1 putative alpha-1,2-mannosidase [Capnocytophaga sp. oral taxon 324 str. F0483]